MPLVTSFGIVTALSQVAVAVAVAVWVEAVAASVVVEVVADRMGTAVVPSGPDTLVATPALAMATLGVVQCLVVLCSSCGGRGPMATMAAATISAVDTAAASVPPARTTTGVTVLRSMVRCGVQPQPLAR